MNTYDGNESFHFNNEPNGKPFGKIKKENHHYDHNPSEFERNLEASADSEYH